MTSVALFLFGNERANVAKSFSRLPQILPAKSGIAVDLD